MTGFDQLDPAQSSPVRGETIAYRHIHVRDLASRPDPTNTGPAVLAFVDDGGTGPELHVCDGSTWNKIWPVTGGGGPHTHPTSEVTGWPLDSSQHGSQPSGDLHPEYLSIAEHALIGDNAPHHPEVFAASQQASGIVVHPTTQEIAHAAVTTKVDLHFETYQLLSEKGAHAGYGNYAGEVVVAAAGGPAEMHTGS